MQILVADDDVSTRTRIARGLRAVGHAALEASTADETLATVAKHKIDAVVLDCFIPGKHGSDIIVALSDVGKSVKIVVAGRSASLSGELAISIAETQGWRRLNKPYTIQELMDVIQRPCND